MNTYDVVVIGLGVMGSASAYSLAKRGVRVLGVDANPPHHALGSSHGPTRATRETYFESPDYVPLARRSTGLWRLLEAESAASLLDVQGGLYLAPAGHPLLTGVSRAAARHGLRLETLDHREPADRFAGFCLPDGWQVLREEGAGLLRAPACLDAFRDQARLCGAELRFLQGAANWRQGTGGVVVDIEGQQVSAAKIVLALGAWACDAASGLTLPLTPRRIPVVYFNTARPEAYRAEDFSVYFWATPEGVFAGKPHFDELGTMLVRHDDGDTDPADAVRRVVTEEDIAGLSHFADKYSPGLNGGIRSAHICLYTMTPTIISSSIGIRRSTTCSWRPGFRAMGSNSPRSSVKSWPIWRWMGAGITRSISCRPRDLPEARRRRGSSTITPPADPTGRARHCVFRILMAELVVFPVQVGSRRSG